MNRIPTYFATLSLVCLMAFGAGNAYAASYDIERGQGFGTGLGRVIEKTGMNSDQDQARKAVREGRVLPLGQVLAKVQRQVPGRLLDANLVDGGGGLTTYLIKLMTNDGNVAIVTADAVTGKILNVRQGGH
ncbi:MAG: PepSY domain-containing protein [Parvibaculaceae bacterium]